MSSADLFLVSLLVASKLLHDDGEEDEVFNEEWANSAGMEKKDLNKLELEFLTNIDWNCYVSPKQFENMTDRIEKSVVQRQINKRVGGWTTYTDINVLSRHIYLQVVWERLANIALQVTAVCLAAYAASLMTMIGTCYALTRANLGPTAVSQSLSTLKSAVTSSSRTVQSSSVSHNTNRSSVPRDTMADLPNMDAATLEQFSDDESETLIRTGLLTGSKNQNNLQHICQMDRRQAGLSFLCRLRHHHHKRKPPHTTGYDMLHPHYSENGSSKDILPNKFGLNDTFEKDEKSNLNPYPDDLITKDENLCTSITSLRRFLSFSMPWKIEDFFLSSRLQEYNDRKTCYSSECQDSWKNVINDPLMDMNWFVRHPSIRQGNALFGHMGKTIIGV